MRILFDEGEQAGARLELVTEEFENTAIGKFILTARGFVAEMERGKAERARSEKIPQGTGKGCYGYTYHRETGKRESTSVRINHSEQGVQLGH